MLSKNRIYPVVVILAMFLMWQYRSVDKEERVHIQGQTMGTTYNIKYFSPEGRNIQPAVDSLLQAFNASLSTYDPNSEVSRLNRDHELTYGYPFLQPVLKASKNIFERTDGAFDPTVGPLVNAWGFGPDDARKPADEVIDSLLQFVGFDKVYFDDSSVRTPDGVQLDFSAIAKGYGVDVVAEYLTREGYANFYVEIGGEVRVKGQNENDPWRTGIEDPTVDLTERGLNAVVSMTGGAMATSGNYRNYYEVDGVRYAHTIVPKTGRQVEHTLLSVTVVAARCMEADAYATAFMVMGLDEAKNVAESDPELEAFFIYNDEQGLRRYTTVGLESSLEYIQ